MRKTKKLFKYEMLPADETKQEYFCPLSLIEGICCPAKISKKKDNITLLLDHTHESHIVYEYKDQLKAKGVRVRNGKHRKHSVATIGSECSEGQSPDKSPPRKKFKVPPEVMEKAKKSKLSSYDCVNRNGERVIVEGYMLVSVDLGPGSKDINYPNHLNGESSFSRFFVLLLLVQLRIL